MELGGESDGRQDSGDSGVEFIGQGLVEQRGTEAKRWSGTGSGDVVFVQAIARLDERDGTSRHSSPQQHGHRVGPAACRARVRSL